MKHLILAALSLFALRSQAGTVYPVQLGQSVNLQPGDVALVQYGNAVSSVSCAGSTSLPSRQAFQSEKNVLFSDLYQRPNMPDISRSQQCSQYSAESAIRQGVADALVDAREICFQAGYTKCQQPMRTDEQYSFQVYGYPGRYACHIVARIIGTR